MRRFDCSSLYQREDIAISLTSLMSQSRRDFLRGKWRGAFPIIIYIVIILIAVIVIIIIYRGKFSTGKLDTSNTGTLNI